MYDIIIYEDKNGKSEIKDYIKSLRNNVDSKSDRIKLRKIIDYIKLLQTYGLTLGEPYVKHIKGEIWELRPIRDRILFAGLYNNKFILLSVFIKKTQKTPKNEISKANLKLEDFRRRNEVQ